MIIGNIPTSMAIRTVCITGTNVAASPPDAAQLRRILLFDDWSAIFTRAGDVAAGCRMGGDTLFYGIHYHILAQDFTGIPSALIVEAIAVRHHQTEQRIGAGTGPMKRFT